jgi:hypothetical protein
VADASAGQPVAAQLPAAASRDRPIIVTADGTDPAELAATVPGTRDARPFSCAVTLTVETTSQLSPPSSQPPPATPAG